MSRGKKAGWVWLLVIGGGVCLLGLAVLWMDKSAELPEKVPSTAVTEQKERYEPRGGVRGGGVVVPKRSREERGGLVARKEHWKGREIAADVRHKDDEAALLSPGEVLHLLQTGREPEAFASLIVSIDAMGASLTNEQAEALGEFLIKEEAPEGMSDSRYHYMINQVLGALVSGENPPSSVDTVLFEALEASFSGSVKQDYVVQHLAYWYDRSSRKEEIRERLVGLLSETGSTVAGTSLTTLSRISEKEGWNDDARAALAERALDMLNAPGTSPASRISALHVASRMGEDPLLVAEAARIANSAESLPLRLAAVASLGNLGGREAKEHLEQLTESGDDLVRNAAKVAIHKLKEKE